MPNVIILGDGPHARVVRHCLLLSGITVLGSFGEEHEPEFRLLLDQLESRKIPYSFHVAIGNGKVRSKLVDIHRSATYLSAISADAVIDPTATLGAGSYVGPMSYVGLNVKVGAHSIINTGALLDHDVNIGDFAHIAGNAYVAGGVIIGDRVFLGAGSTVIDSVEIGSDIIVGAGSVVTKSISASGTYVGVPAKKIK